MALSTAFAIADDCSLHRELKNVFYVCLFYLKNTYYCKICSKISVITGLKNAASVGSHNDINKNVLNQVLLQSFDKWFPMSRWCLWPLGINMNVTPCLLHVYNVCLYMSVKVWFSLLRLVHLNKCGPKKWIDIWQNLFILFSTLRCDPLDGSWPPRWEPVV